MQKFNLAKQTIRELNEYLHQDTIDTDTIEVMNPDGNHNIAVGIKTKRQVNIKGNVGYYCGGMNQFAQIYIEGNAGPGLAENMMSGQVVVSGSASQYCGASAHGGLLVVHGNVSSRCGISMKGADIVVGGSIGHMSAFMAQSGRLVVCGNAGDYLGDSIYEARLYIKGDINNLGADCVEKKMTASHTKEVETLLHQAGIKANAAAFRRYGSARKLYHFHIDNSQTY